MKHSRIILLVAAAVAVAIGVAATSGSCSKKQDVSEKILQLREMSELGTVEYTVKKVISANDTTWYKLGDRKIYFTCEAVVKAGVDLKRFSASNVKISDGGRTVAVVLPRAKILSVNLPPHKIQEKYCSVTGFRSSFTPEERLALQRQAEVDIRRKVQESGICADAERNAAELVRTLLSGGGREVVNVKFE